MRVSRRRDFLKQSAAGLVGWAAMQYSTTSARAFNANERVRVGLIGCGGQGSNLGGVSVSSTDANQSVQVMLNEIARLQTQPISGDELQGTVQHYLTRYYLDQETNAAQAGELARAELLGGGWRTSTVFMDKISAVTPADVQRVAQKYMRNIRFVVLGNPQSVDTHVFTGS